MDKIFSLSYEEHLNIQKATNIKTIWLPIIFPEINNELTLEEKIVYDELKNKFNNNYIILFTGILNKSSNIRAAIWFSKKVLPLILKSIKEVKFFIVGKKPVKELYKIQNSNVLLFTDVPSIKPYFLLSNLTVNPIFNSAGVKVKLLESLLYKKMVVSTSKGLNGSGLSDIVPNADDPEGFAKLCIDSLLGNINFETIFKNFNNIYNNTKNFELFEEELKSL